MVPSIRVVQDTTKQARGIADAILLAGNNGLGKGVNLAAKRQALLALRIGP
jgi:hypothetical protein